MRLNHYLAKAGVGSRREAERLMAEGRVRVNGQLVPPGGVDVRDSDTVTVDGKRVAPETAPLPRLFIYHKPVGPLVTADDPQGRPTIWDVMPKTLPGGGKLPRLVSVGRLDAASEGLLLLTNDGLLAQTLMSPKTALERTYRVRAFGEITNTQLDKIRRGVTVKGVRYRGAEIVPEALTPKGQRNKTRLPTGSGKNAWYRMVLTEGKNREIRRIFDSFGANVNRLIRVKYGMFVLRDLPRNALVEVPPGMVRTFMDKLEKQEKQARKAKNASATPAANAPAGAKPARTPPAGPKKLTLAGATKPPKG